MLVVADLLQWIGKHYVAKIIAERRDERNGTRAEILRDRRAFPLERSHEKEQNGIFLRLVFRMSR